MDLSDLKICFIAGTLGRGGAERQLVYMLRVLLNMGAQVHVVSLTKGEPYEAVIRDLGVPMSWVGRVRSRPLRMLHVVREVGKVKPTVVQSTHTFANAYAAVAGRLAGAVPIGAVRLDGTRDVIGAGYIGYLTLKLPIMLVANSQQAIRTLEAAGVRHGRLYYVPNSVDCDVFQPAMRSASDKPVKVINVGTLTQRKRQDLFLQAVARVGGDDSSLRASLIGSGPWEVELRAMASALGINEHVAFLGDVGNVAPLYHSADLLVHTSDAEGMPNVVMEAMASGLPVIATDVGAAPDLIDDGQTGYIIQPGDLDALTLRMAELVSNPDLRAKMGQAAREKILRDYSLPALERRLARLYKTRSNNQAQEILSEPFTSGNQ